MSRISPIVLLVIVILAAIFFVFGLVHLLVRCLIKRPSFSSISQSNRHTDTSGSHTFQRQLQQLFRLHDSGLDQALIDALPIFYYKDIMGLKEPFDCAVCLSEFSEADLLRLLPLCGHAFHIHCIDTWLLSNSTCPLCRSLISSGFSMGNPLFNIDELREPWNCISADMENELSCSLRQEIMQENIGEMRVFSIRLGKFRSVNEGGEIGDRNQLEMSSCTLDGRRCYSMGTFQYVVASELQVALSRVNGASVKPVNNRCENGHLTSNTDREGKKISARTRGESYSVSKIWLWSEKESPQSSSAANTSLTSLNFGVPVAIS